jgi:hypothetical protein
VYAKKLHTCLKYLKVMLHMDLYKHRVNNTQSMMTIAFMKKKLIVFMKETGDFNFTVYFLNICEANMIKY